MTYAEKVAYLSGISALTRTLPFNGSSYIADGYGGDYGFFLNAGEVGSTAAVVDDGAIKLTTATNSDSGAAGQLYANFSADRLTHFGASTTFSVQWQMKFNRQMIQPFTTVSGPGNEEGFKQMIMSVGDPAGTCTTSSTGTCTTSNSFNQSIVMQNVFGRGWPRWYYYIDTGSPLQPMEDSSTFPGDITWQNQRPSPYCLYSQRNNTPPSPGCFKYATGFTDPAGTNMADISKWATVTMKFNVGTYSAGPPPVFTNTRMRSYWAWQGESEQFLHDYTANFGALNTDGWGKIWLLPYITGKSHDAVHETGYVWYKNFIVANGNGDIPLTTDEVTSTASIALVLR